MENYILAGYKDTFDKMWNLEEALRTGNMFFNEGDDLVKKLNPNDSALIREFNNGIVAKGTIDEIYIIRDIYLVRLKELEIFKNPVLQHEYFYDISNPQKQSRIIQITDSDYKIIKDKLK